MSELANRLRQHGFRLGGSRRFAELYPDDIKLADDTDYDFYFDDKLEGAVKFLEAEGFKRVQLENTDYCDTLLIDIYKHPTERVEVLRRSDAHLYQKAFESISRSEFLYRIWKSTPHVACTDFHAFKKSVQAFMNYRFEALKADEIIS